MTAWKAILVGLGVMRLLETIKEIVPWPMQPFFKSILATVIGAALSVWLSDDLKDRVLITLGAAGTSALSHEVRDYLSVSGDRAKLDVMIRSARRM